MSHPYVSKLARLLVHYSLDVKRGDWVHIRGSVLSADLMVEAAREVLGKGAHPTVDAEIQGLRHMMLQEGNEAQITRISPLEKLAAQKADKLLAIMGGFNTREMSGIAPKKMSMLTKARGPVLKTFFKRTKAGDLRWCGTLFPTHSGAQDAELALSEYEDFVYRSMKLHRKDPVAEWKKVRTVQDRLVKKLMKIKEIHIVGPGTDLKVGVGGRSWVNCSGEYNFPDGEVFTGPRENSVDGKITYGFPAVYNGHTVEDIALTWRKGRVVEAEAGKGKSYLKAILGTDPGAKRLGEMAFGTNYDIQRHTKNVLFDEKIGGTMHFAVGASIPESGGVNKSAVHWDMVCETRKGYTIYGDGKPIHKNGKFLI
ncbi:MAG: aminopeptidase [Gemmatimonadetes bacterium]|nr:aminopeptidase [Gemmatimonadota bacterium]